MTKKTVFTEKAPTPVGPYSQAVASGEFVFISGQIALDPKTLKIVEGGIEAQTIRIFENIKKILESIDLNLSDVVKTSVFLSDISDFNVFNRVYSKYFEKEHPARTTVQVNLMVGVLVEIDAIAQLKR